MLPLRYDGHSRPPGLAYVLTFTFGQEQRSPGLRPMSGLTPETHMATAGQNVGLRPIGEIRCLLGRAWFSPKAHTFSPPPGTK
jgi:hypothetical protein